MAFRRTGEGVIHFVKRAAFLFILVFILSLFSASIVLAQVQTRLRIIQALNVGSGIDPSLRDLHDQLGTLSGFTSYRLLRDETLSLSSNRPVSIPLHEGRSIEITLTGQQRETAELRVKMRREKTDILNTQVRLSRGRTVLIGGLKHGEGVLLLALSAHF